MTLTLEQLDDYLARHLKPDEVDAFEEAMFDAAARGDDATLRFLDKLRRSLADLAARGSYEITLTVAELKELQRTTKLRLHVFDPVRDANLDAEAALAQLDLVVWELAAPLAGVNRVDLELGYGDKTFITLPDVKVDRDHDRVLLCCEGELARAAIRRGSFVSVVAVDGQQRRTLAKHAYAPPPL